MQDTPANKITYEAHVVVKNEFKVKMSANDTGTSWWNSTHTQFHFINHIPMPSYLIAIAVGELEKVSCSRGRVLDDWVFSPTLLLQKKIFLSTT